MSDVIELPRYRFRGSVAPSADVSRPLAVTRNAASGNAPAGSSATLDIFDVIDSYGGWWGISANEVDAALKEIGDVDTLFVRLNSPGGEATEGVAIANLLRAHKATVRITVYGLAASAASYIATAGDVVSMGPGSLMFVHDAWNIVLGDAADMRKVADTLDVISDSIAGLYVLKAGGTTENWRAAMHADTWYSAESAVKAKLADRVGLDPDLPADLPPVEEDTDDEATVIEIDVEISPAARAAARRFDLSMFPNAPAALAPNPPAASADGSTETQERSVAVEFTDEQLNTMRQQLGLPEDADAAAIVAAQAEALDEAADPPAADPPGEIDAATATAALAKDGKVVVSQAYLDTLKEGSEAGRAALARQSREDRDKAIAQAQSEGKIGRSEDVVKAWQVAWDRDPANTAKEIGDLGVRFPVGEPRGFAGDDGTVGDSAAPWSEAEADALGAMAGLPKGALR